MSEQPWDFGTARQKASEAKLAQKASETFARDCWKRYAEAERVYRMRLSERIVALRAEGTAVTAAGDIARGEADVADLKMKRDIAEGMRDVAQQAAWRANADRKDMHSFLEWSMKRELAENGFPEPQWGLRTRGELRRGETA